MCSCICRFKLGLLNNKVKVKMPGGILKISINDNNQLQMEGQWKESVREK